MQVDPVSPLIVPFYKFLFGGLAKPSDFDGVRFWMKKPTLALALPIWLCHRVSACLSRYSRTSVTHLIATLFLQPDPANL